MNKKVTKFLINKLLVVGIKKNYTVEFEEGLNIIYGDSDTGKSSILELIDYCFGASTFNLYTEIETNGKYCLLEIRSYDTIYTIKRDFFYPKNYIEVYESSAEEVLSSKELKFPKLLSPNYSEAEGPSGYFSDFMLELLNIPRVRIKSAPSQVDSSPRRISFRDIMHYCYLNQDDIGSKNILSYQNNGRYSINKQIFKFINQILDEQITELEEIIAEKQKNKASLINKEDIIASFLQETQIPEYNDLLNKVDSLKKSMISINSELVEIDSGIIDSTKQLNSYRELYRTIENNIVINNSLIKEKNESQIQYSKLKSSYLNDVKKYKATLKIDNPFLRTTISDFDCPLCLSKVKLESLLDNSETSDTLFIKKEISLLNEKSKNLNALIYLQKKEIDELENEKSELELELNKLGNKLNTTASEFINPILATRDVLLSKKTEMEEKTKQYIKELKTRNQVEIIHNEIVQMTKNIEDLKIELNELKDKAPSDIDVKNKLGDSIKKLIENIGLQNIHGVSIDKSSFLPVFRDKHYSKITSGGVRTALSFSYFLALLERTIEKDLNKPPLLLLDTIGKYIGKKSNARYLDETDINEDNHEKLRNDPEKYSNMYKELLRVIDFGTKKNKSIQIIVVDNDNPGNEYDEFVRKKFSITPKEGFEIGFINDIKRSN